MPRVNSARLLPRKTRSTPKMSSQAARRGWALGVVALLMLPGRAARAEPISIAAAAQTTLTFEDLPENDSRIRSYGGLQWDTFFVENIRTQIPPGIETGYRPGATSGVHVAFSDRRAAILGPSFTFNSGQFTAAWRTGLSLNIVGEGRGEVHDATLTLNPFAPTLFAPNWTGIQHLTFIPSGGIDAFPNSGSGKNFVLDDFTFSALAPTPEPTPLLLAAIGLIGIAIRRWRCNVKRSVAA